MQLPPLLQQLLPLPRLVIYLRTRLPPLRCCLATQLALPAVQMTEISPRLLLAPVQQLLSLLRM